MQSRQKLIEESAAPIVPGLCVAVRDPLREKMRVEGRRLSNLDGPRSDLDGSRSGQGSGSGRGLPGVDAGDGAHL